MQDQEQVQSGMGISHPQEDLVEQGGGDDDSQQAQLDHSRALEAIDDCAGLRPKRARIDDGHQIGSVGFGLF